MVYTSYILAPHLPHVCGRGIDINTTASRTTTATSRAAIMTSRVLACLSSILTTPISRRAGLPARTIIAPMPQQSNNYFKIVGLNRATLPYTSCCGARVPHGFEGLEDQMNKNTNLCLDVVRDSLRDKRGEYQNGAIRYCSTIQETQMLIST